jgi:hypothetical protein
MRQRLACLLGLVAGLLLVDARAADDLVGVNTHFDQDWKPAELMPMVADLGVGWIRDGVSWGDVEPEKHHYVVPAKTQAWIDAAHALHLHVLLMLYYANKNYADPFSPPDYANAAAFLAKALAGRVDAIEILNEPNNPPFQAVYGGMWNGREGNGSVSPWVAKYAELIRAAVPAIKAANPHMKVIGYGAPPPATFRIMRLGTPPQLDGITDHPYSGAMKLPELVPYPATPDLVVRDGIATADFAGTYRSQCAMFRAEAAKDGLPHAELWNTEWGFATSRPKDKPDEALSPETQAVYTLRRLLESRALGVMTFYYDLRDDGTDPTQDWQQYGLVDYFRKPKPAFDVFKRFTHVFDGLEGNVASNEKMAETKRARLYTYHQAGSKDEWYAGWEVGPYPSPTQTTNAPIDLSIDTTFHHATAINLYDGHERELEIKPGANGRLSFQLPVDPVPLVVHLHN